MLTKTKAYLFIESLFYDLKSKIFRFIKSFNVTIEKKSLTHENIQKLIIEEELKTVVVMERLQRKIEELKKSF